MTTTQQHIPAEVFPPGEFLRDELEARNWSQTEFSQIIDRPARLVSEILSAKKAITPETAMDLAAALGTSPQYWMNLESGYRLFKASLEERTARDNRIHREAKLREKYPVRDIIKRGWITIETINGEKMTVVLYAGEWKNTPVMQMLADVNIDTIDCGEFVIITEGDYHIATALPALPRNPTPEDAPLLYRYASEGIAIFISEDKWRKGLFVGVIDECSTQVGTLMVQEQFMERAYAHPDEVFPDQIIYSLREGKAEITHATHNGERVEIAIKENEDGITN